MPDTRSESWPELPYDHWSETCETLHLWLQIVGKVKLALAPFLNELWQVAFQVTPRGMTTGLIPWGDGAFSVDLDFVAHNLHVRTSDGRTKSLPLIPQSVARFYAEFMQSLRALGIEVVINTLPSEVPAPIHCHVDEVHASYDPVYVTRWWRILLRTDLALQRFRSGFVGKSSPVHFFWGSFDLAHTRFSGRAAPPLQGVPRFFQIAEDQENFTCGFWPGNPNQSGFAYGEPAYYAYMYPEPDGFRDATVRPSAAHFDSRLGEFVLPYEAVRSSASPADTIVAFVESTYAAGADLGRWEREKLEPRAP